MGTYLMVRNSNNALTVSRDIQKRRQGVFIQTGMKKIHIKSAPDLWPVRRKVHVIVIRLSAKNSLVCFMRDHLFGYDIRIEYAKYMSYNESGVIYR